MSRDTLTVIVLPSGAGRPRTITFRKDRLRLAAAGVLVFLGAVALLLLSHRSLRRQVAELEYLRAEANSQRSQVASMVEEMDGLKDQFQRLQNLDHKLRLLASLEPPSGANKPLSGLGGPDPSSTSSDEVFISDRQSALVESMRRELDSLKVASVRQEGSFRELESALQEMKSQLASTPSVWPVKGWVTSGFGSRISPFTGRKVMHTGLDIATRKGSLITSPADGVVIRVNSEYDFGKLVEVDHGYGIVTRYGHNSQVLVRVGQRVRRGQPIARVGNTGRSTGPHLHYEVRLNGIPINPKRYIVEEDTL